MAIVSFDLMMLITFGKEETGRYKGLESVTKTDFVNKSISLYNCFVM